MLLPDFEQVGRLLMSQSWRFASTMAYVPHYYSLRKNWASMDDFFIVVEFIQQHGIDELYYKRPFRVLLINEFKYWTMEGNNIQATDLINRKPHELPLANNPDVHWVRFD